MEKNTLKKWEVVVVGAGPAGALTAYLVARRGIQVLLVDKEPFPRRKVCGCCMNGAALGVLRQVGLGDLPHKLGAQPLTQFQLFAAGRRAIFPLPAGVALSREAFDTALVQQAIQAGADFLPQTTAVAHQLDSSSRRLLLRAGHRHRSVQAKVVVIAAGLSAGNLHAGGAPPSTSAPGSRIGVGAVVDEAPAWYRPGKIYMVCSPSGYVGLVRREDGRLNVAASLDVKYLKALKQTRIAVSRILKSAALPPIENPPSQEVSWVGTIPLAQRRRWVAEERLFLVGDAAGYVEPFTGEGMAWALGGAVALTPLVAEAVGNWQPTLANRWEQEYHQSVGQRQWWCRVTSAILKRPIWVKSAMSLATTIPFVSAAVIQAINQPFPLGVRN